MGDLQTAISKLVDVAVEWQIREKSDSDLTAADQTVQTAIAKAQKDIDQIIAASKVSCPIC